MVDLDFAQSTFEYALRKKIFDGDMPSDGAAIQSEDRYYIVNHKGVTFQNLWDKIIDERKVERISEEEHFDYFNDCIDAYIGNLSITDPIMPGSEKKLSDLPYWISVKNIPKKYYRR